MTGVELCLDTVHDRIRGKGTVMQHLRIGKKRIALITVEAFALPDGDTGVNVWMADECLGRYRLNGTKLEKR